MKKIIFFLILFFNFSYADYLNSNTNTCVSSYWYFLGNLYYKNSSDGLTVSSSSKNLQNYFYDGFEYNSTSGVCQKIGANNSLGLPNDFYSSAMAVTGLICGSLLSICVILGIRISL